MAKLIDAATNQSVDVPDEQVPSALTSKKYGLRPGTKLRVRAPDGEFGYIPAENALKAFQSGFTTPTAEEESTEQDRKDFTTPGMKAMAGAVGLVRGVVPAADQVIKAGADLIGVPDTMPFLRKLDEHNKGISTAAEVAGSLATLGFGGARAAAALPGLASRAGVAAGGILGRLGIRAAEKAATKTAAAAGVKELAEAGFRVGAKKWIGSTAAAVAEGAVFGANKLASEQALGRAEINKENIIAYVGGTALLGGAVGGVLSATGGLAKYGIGKTAEALNKGIVKKASGGLEKVSEIFSLKSAGITGGAQKQIHKKSDLGRAVKVFRTARHPDGQTIIPSKITGSSIDDVAIRLGDTVEHHGKRIGRIIDDTDTALGEAHVLSPQRIADRIRKELHVPLVGRPGAKEAMSAADGFANDYAALGGSMTLREAQGHRLDWARNWRGGRSTDPASLTTLKQNIERIIADEIGGGVSAAAAKGAISKQTAREFFESKKVYGGLVRLAEESENAAIRTQGNRWLSITDTMTGAAGFAAKIASGANDVSAAAQGIFMAMAHKALRERGPSIIATVANKASTLGAIQNVGNVVQNKIDKVASSFVYKNIRRVAPASASMALLHSDFGPKGKAVPRAKNIRVAAKLRSEELSSLVSNPTALADHIASRLDGLESHAPAIAAGLAGGMASAVSFLAEKAPKRPHVPQNMITSIRDWEPSDAEAHRFARYVSAVSAPLSSLDRLTAHTVTREDAEVWDRLLPERKALIGQSIINEYGASGKTPSHDDLVALSIFFGKPFVASMDPGFIARQQQVFSRPPPVSAGGNSVRVSGIDKLTLDQRMAGQAERLESPV